MSTRSVIARKTEGDAFIGRYSHYDGYPSGVGIGVINAFSEFPFEKAVSILLDEHPGGWSSIADADWTKEIGYVNYDHPEFESLRKAPNCFCHGGRSEDGWTITNLDDAGVEFAYVIDESNKTMTIYERTHDNGDHATGFFGMATGGGWNPIGKVNLDIDTNSLVETMLSICPMYQYQQEKVNS